ncbi:MAG: hypothetical protein ACOXZ6_01250 [Syntrophomonadaceae bacterium]
MPLFVKIVLGTSSLAVLMALLPFLTVVVAILWGCSLLLAALNLDQKRLITVIIINIIIVLSVSGLEETLFLLAFFIIPAVVISLGGAARPRLLPVAAQGSHCCGYSHQPPAGWTVLQHR